MLKSIDSAQLRPGMYVHRLLGSWMDHPFWRSAFLADEDDVARIHGSRVERLVIDTGRGLDTEEDAEWAAAEAEPVETDTESPEVGAGGRSAASSGVAPDDAAAGLEAEIARARRICQDGRETVQAMFQEIRLGRAVNPEAAMPLVESITASVRRNPHALISVARLKTADDYTYLHSMAVAALMTALARQLGMDEEQVMQAAMGGLLHDLGKALTPSEVLNKPGSLSDDEFALVRLHPEQGHRLLTEGGVHQAPVLDVVLHHHEKVDGSGYPRRLAGEAIPLKARMAAVCDVYDAITSNRPYKRGWDPAESLKRMASWQGHFDPALFQAFVKSLGIYPVGALVRLASQHLAVVLEQNPQSLLTPRVRVFFSIRLNSQVLMRDIDLAASGCHDRIVGPESPTQWGFRDLEKLWMG